MKPEWKALLIDNGAEFGDDNGYEVQSFGNPEREQRVTLSGNVICDLSHKGLMQVYGEDARSFLQNQLTNDIQRVDERHSVLAAHCNPKGRVLALFRVFQRGETFYLSTSRDVLEDSLQRLQKYVLMSKVTLEDGNDALVRMGLSGPQAEDELRAAGLLQPAVDDGVEQTGGYTVIRLPGLFPRFEIYGELEPMQRLWDKLNVRCAPVGAPAWRLLEILAGIPLVVQATSGQFVPQMINLDLINGVSFTKGCYPGQEIVARTRYLGKLKRRMYRLHFDIDQPPAPGTAIYSPADETRQPIGAVVAAAPHPDGGVESLAVVTIRFVEEGAPLALGAPDGPAGSLQYPPYEIPAPERE